MSQEHINYANGLRELANWIESHPEISLPNDVIHNYALNTKEEAALCLRALKPCKKEYTEDFFKLVRNFGPIKVIHLFNRDAVCQRVVTGKRIVQAHLDPGYVVPAKMVEAHEEDIVEWRCGDALLDSDFNDMEAANEPQG